MYSNVELAKGGAMAWSREPKGSTKFARQRQTDRLSQRTRNSVRPRLASKNGREFNPHEFLATIGERRKIVPVAKK